MRSRPASPAPSLRRPLALAALLVAAASAAGAAPPRPDPRDPLDPLDPAAAAPALVHRSPLQTHRRLPEVPPPEGARWREGNETVNRIGGWRAYAREAAAAAAPAAPAAPTASAPVGERR